MFQLASDSSNSEANGQFELTKKLIQAAKEAQNAYDRQDYAKAIDSLSTIVEVRKTMLHLI